MTDEVLLSTTEGQRPDQKASDFAHSGRLAQPGLELRFEHLSFSVKGKQILEDISGTAHPGKVMAVMGPSGSGKTTLLNVLGGRVQCARCQATIGGLPLTKKTRRKISYVLQQDIFFPNLTLQQTLEFAAELRLPESMPTACKKEIVAQLIEQLDMEKCTKTIIGDNMNRGLSGGEKKRANIANELLTDPAVLLLDEPTSGLDSSTAYALTISLKKYAVQSGKTVMMTIHQPSVQMFYQFDTILLLSAGRIAYYGTPSDVVSHFAEMGHSCDTSHYNPADFILDVVKSGSEAAEHLIADSNQRRLTTPDCPILPETVAGKAKGALVSRDDVVITTETGKEKFSNLNLNESDLRNGNYSTGNGKAAANDEKYISRDPEKADVIDDVKSSVDESDLSLEDENRRRWPTSFTKQLSVLTIRSFIQGKYRYLSTLKFVKTIGVALITGLVWWQIGRGKITEQQALDIGGALFFITVFNSFNSLFDVLVIFPSEREVVNKERMGGSYRLSSYYISKTISELPLALVLPSISMIIFYWMAGLNGYNNAWAFFGSWLDMIMVTIASQSLGIFVSAATMDFEHGLVLAIFMMITYMLLGGFYIKSLPPWLSWLRYVSPFLYAWTLMLYFEFDSDYRVICNTENSLYPSCLPPQGGGNDTMATISSNTTRYVKKSEILVFNGADVPAWICCVALVTTLVLFRVLGYVLLRLFHKPIVK
ncbi:unnamed protein product [Clavelina lepadiformis]|uniref:ABC transporter domain-containing protein n=1 Tax=Clavelina lepadiformis TaxID=159417 RepID=A0ABP0GI22_CLALP